MPPAPKPSLKKVRVPASKISALPSPYLASPKIGVKSTICLPVNQTYNVSIWDCLKILIGFSFEDYTMKDPICFLNNVKIVLKSNKASINEPIKLGN